MEAGQGGRKYWSIENCFDDDPRQLTRTQLHSACDTGLHAHEFYEMSIVLRGSGYHILGEICVSVCAGCVFVVPPGMLHSFRNQEKLDVLNILIRGEFFVRYSEEVNGMPGFTKLFEIEPYLRQAVGEGFFLQLDAGQMQLRRSEWEKLLWYMERRLYTNHNVAVLHLIEEFSLQMQREFEEHLQPDIVSVIEYINQHLSEKLSLQQLADLTHMSLSTFQRFFKRNTAMNPMEYVMMCRVDTARRLLREGKLSKTQIAAACGFYDTSHMNKYL